MRRLRERGRVCRLSCAFILTRPSFALLFLSPFARSLKEKKIKNVTRDELGATLGRIHMERQDMAGLQLKKTRATKAEIRERKKAAKAEGAGGAGAEEEEEEEEEEEDGEEEEAAEAETKRARR